MRVVRTVTTALAWAVAVLVVLIAMLRQGGPLAFARVGLEQPALTITGSIGGLAPGVPAALVLTVNNSGDDVVVVRLLTARVMDAPSTRCPASALQLISWRGRLPVAAHAAATASLPIRLSPSARGCRGVTWHLAYNAG